MRELTDIEKAIEIVDELYAVEILEYHNKNWLACDDKARSIDKQATLNELKSILNMIKEYNP